jgi:predicted  nucleic acid-binding Zn-ribbon protein
MNTQHLVANISGLLRQSEVGIQQRSKTKQDLTRRLQESIRAAELRKGAFSVVQGVIGNIKNTKDLGEEVLTSQMRKATGLQKQLEALQRLKDDTQKRIGQLESEIRELHGRAQAFRDMLKEIQNSQ